MFLIKSVFFVSKSSIVVFTSSNFPCSNKLPSSLKSYSTISPISYFFNLPKPLSLNLPKPLSPNQSESFLNVFGLTFAFNEGRYELTSKTVTPSDLIDTANTVLNSYALINQKGFVSLDHESVICIAIQKHLISLGLKNTLIGNSNNTYQL